MSPMTKKKQRVHRAGAGDFRSDTDADFARAGICGLTATLGCAGHSGFCGYGMAVAMLVNAALCCRVDLV